MIAKTRETLAALAAMLVASIALWPRVVHACPMCFNGNDQNGDAFLYGSLFMMFVPTVAIGGLGYWAYRRIRAAEAGWEPRDGGPDATPPNATGSGAGNSGNPVALRVVERR